MISIRFFETTEQLPIVAWDALIGHKNLLLSTAYFKALEESCPDNMKCYAVGFFRSEQLIGVALFQEMRFSSRHSFGNAFEKISRIKQKFFLKLGHRILVVGNNMLSGQNAFSFSPEVTTEEQLRLLSEALRQFERVHKRPCLVVFKDFETAEFDEITQKPSFLNRFASFRVQPSMVLSVRPEWTSYQDYLAAFSTKYRTRANTARKKMEGFVCRELTLDDCVQYKKEILDLYLAVSEKADFNFFTLNEGHFISLKKNLGDQFRIFAYFKGDVMVGMYSLICNQDLVDTYFLGYNADLQKQHQLYLNMLLDMAKWGIEHGFGQINYGRTALEIKSTIGAKPVEMRGFMQHFLWLIQKGIDYYFSSLFKEEAWIQREPFKDTTS